MERNILRFLRLFERFTESNALWTASSQDRTQKSKLTSPIRTRNHTQSKGLWNEAFYVFYACSKDLQNRTPDGPRPVKIGAHAKAKVD